jgi:PHP family Zn ribbon phosphoesterase
MKAELRFYSADLHLHTTLSPCGDAEMVPELIYTTALEKGLQVLAITDHNSTRNLPAFLKNCPPELWVIPGMEVQTKEEIHLVCLFPSLEPAMAWGEQVRRLLPPVENKKGYFGNQTILGETGGPVGEENRLLLNSIILSLTETVDQVRSLGGIIYPAHIDRPAFSITSQIGFLPPEPVFTLLEVSPRSVLEKIRRQYTDHVFIRSSDAHYLNQIGVKTSTLKMAGLYWEELLLAFAHQEQRAVILN